MLQYNVMLCWMRFAHLCALLMHITALTMQAYPLHPPWQRTEKSLQNNLKHVSIGFELGESDDDRDIHDEL
jgi:hypothetical protein